jgi:hypothetical protein
MVCNGYFQSKVYRQVYWLWPNAGKFLHKMVACIGSTMKAFKGSELIRASIWHQARAKGLSGLVQAERGCEKIG